MAASAGAVAALKALACGTAFRSLSLILLSRAITLFQNAKLLLGLQNGGKFGWGKLYWFGDQQPLFLNVLLQYFFSQLLIDDTFVKRVLINDHDAVLVRRDQVAVVNLHGA